MTQVKATQFNMRGSALKFFQSPQSFWPERKLFLIVIFSHLLRHYQGFKNVVDFLFIEVYH